MITELKDDKMKTEMIICNCRLMTYNLFLFKPTKIIKKRRVVYIFILSSFNLNNRALKNIYLTSGSLDQNLPKLSSFS